MSDVKLRPELVKQLEALLQGGQAHAGFDKAVAEIPLEAQGTVPAGVPYSAWQLLEHLRIAQRDIVDFSTDADGEGYAHKEWPAAYWPKNVAPPNAEAWDGSVAAIRADREKFVKLLRKGDLTTPFAWGDGQNLLREALLIADHGAYHVGELVLVRRLLGVWQAG